MKSGKAKKIIRETDLYISVQGVMFQDSRAMMKKDAIKAVEIAEREAEERMWKKAVRAYCQDCCCTVVGECRYGIGSEKCDALRDFIQKLNENENTQTSR